MNKSLIVLAAALGLPATTVMAQTSSAPVELPPIIVTSDPLGDRGPDQIVQPVTVLRGEELDRKRRSTIGELLSDEPGVSSADFGPGVGRPVIRGQSGSRVLILDDGVRTMDVANEGADHAVALDPLHAEQVEVIRGPATLIYGSGAAGGVVNVRHPRLSQDFAQGLSADLDFSFSDNADERLGRVGLAYGLSPSFVLRGDYGVRRAGDLDIPGFQEIDQDADEGQRGRLQNSSAKSDSGSVSALWRSETGYAGLSLSRFRADYGIPEVLDPDDLEFERVEIDSHRIDFRGERLAPFAGFSSARLKLAYTDFDQQEVEFEAEDDGFESTVEALFENREYEARLEMTHLPLAGWRGVLGLQFNDRDFFALADPEDDEPENFYVPATRTRSGALFLVEERETGFGRIELGARVERNRSNPDTLAARSFTPVSLSAGSIIDVGEAHHVRLLASRSQRAPAAEELFADGRHAAAGTFEIGDAGLKVETNHNVEIGLDRHLGRWTWDVSVFYNRVDDYIFLQPELDGGMAVMVNDDGETAAQRPDCSPGDGGDCRFRNRLVNVTQGDARFYGAEAVMSYALLQGPVSVNLRLFADSVRGQLRGDAGGDLPRITPDRYGAGIDGGWKGFRYAVDLRRNARQSRTGLAESETAGFNLLSADLSWTLREPGTAVTYFLRGRNLLDEEARRHTSFLKDEAPLAGRAVIAGVRLQFGN
jgi:iron complex outermembrane receptor protein